MDFVGVYPSLHHTRGLEAIICLTTATQIFVLVFMQRKSMKLANSQGGLPSKSGLPSSFMGRIITPIHGLAIAIPPVVYTVAVVWNGLTQPAWIEQRRLPFEIGAKGEALTRLAACVASSVVVFVVRYVTVYLGKQFHYIGVREKPSVVSTGPYGLVRHPLYTLALLTTPIMALMFWSYFPLIFTVIIAVALALKMPIEEQLMIDNPIIGPKYVQYKQKVTSRVIPGLW